MSEIEKAIERVRNYLIDGWRPCSEDVVVLRDEHARLEADNARLAAALKDAENVLDGIEQGRGCCGEFFCADLAEKQRARRADRTAILSARDAAEQVKGAVKALKHIEKNWNPREIITTAQIFNYRTLIERGASKLPPDAPGESEAKA